MLNVIIAMIIIIIFILIFLSNNEGFAAGPAAAPGELRVAPSPRGSIAGILAESPDSSPVGEPSSNNKHLNKEMRGLDGKLTNANRQNQQAQHKVDVDEEKLGRSRGKGEGEEQEFQKCMTQLSRISSAIDGDITRDEHGIINIINKNNEIVNKDLDAIYKTLLSLKSYINKDNTSTSKLLSNISDHVYKGAQTNQTNIVNYLTKLDNYVSRLQGETMNAMQKTIIDSVNKLIYELMEQNVVLKDHCSKKPKHICDSIPECMLNVYGYDLYSCGLNPDSVI